MKIQIKTFNVNKRFPLTISRGTTSQSTNIWLEIEAEGITGWGEASPFSIGNSPQTTPFLQETFQQIAPKLEQFHPLQRQQIEQVFIETKLPSAACAAIDVALHDWMGKKAGLPLWKLWGLDCNNIVPTSVTVGINTPEAAVKRVRDWVNFLDAKVFKIKLGNPQGISADQSMFTAVYQEVPQAKFSVDANGGWSLEDAVKMCEWLAEYGVTYVEQPLEKGEEKNLLELKQKSSLSIFVDESCFTSKDIPSLADKVDGINIKLMKSGGLTEAMRMINTAKACGLKVMFGCYSDSSLANTALSHLSPLADYLDLDSHLNLLDDSFNGATIKEGRLLPNDLPGLGIIREDKEIS
ncbi:dipeptide epimerase [Phormidium sp. LEGE 05292]|uniref:dipeptide epimerase n=1 Tax=[Phormidium] sp. LEGE 05292 TaxID=767427 RepID=UPI0018805243|nr:dipeptide epimerase [Phormidium sp. LEGE 05292]MBE9227864.1 dipeptide epimerase [Phormidium sp. LEGE 05292]